ncbi:glycosyltransferase [Desulfovibrio sp. UCD-KL4C]|uniref:glycosyltransferase n=1 Tax=Desulfovibrio sp. UCD-KL4C TaxID=2578120 RepID=UPI0025BF85A1|nr:glycosyltransferase [Desulfovibrio sp. UCD-KL4C]
MKSKGITAVIRSMGGGGAERVLTNMLNYWAEQGRPVSLITNTLADTHVYALHPSIRSICIPPINIPNNLDDCPWDVIHLRQAITMERNDTVISFMEKSNIPTIMATLGLPVRVIISERIDPRTQTKYSEYKKNLARKLYPFADALVVQTQSVKAWAEEFMEEEKVSVIRNMVTLEDSYISPPFPPPQKFICCMGRITKNKGLPGLVENLPKIFEKFPDHHLVILGDGEDQKALEAQVAALNLGKKVHILGFLSNAHSILKKAEVFVLPSLCEGFPNALIEAMVLGVPSISFDCPSGPSEIIDHEKNGLLIPEQNYEALTSAIMDLLDSPKKRANLSRNAKIWVQSECELNMIMEKWNKLCW